MLFLRLRRLALLLLLPAAAAQAAPSVLVADLYQAQVPVQSQAEAERQAAMREALRLVLDRVSGDTAGLPGVERVIEQAPRYAQRYQYLTPPEPAPEPESTPATDVEPRPAPPPLLLRVHFDGRALTEALKNYDLPVWPERRAVTLVWVAAPDATGRAALLDQATVATLYPELPAIAAARGAPLLFPLMDWRDASALDVADLRQDDFARLQEASARYEVRHVLALDLESWGAQWTARATALVADAAPQQWSANGATPGQALAAAMERQVAQLVQRYAVRSQGGWSQEVRLRVSGVQSLGDYGRTLNFLDDLAPVRRVQVAEVVPDQAVFLVLFDGDLPSLEQAIALGRLLQPAERVPAPPVDGLTFHAVSSRPELHYRIR